jgi:hypothetical protein
MLCKVQHEAASIHTSLATVDFRTTKVSGALVKTGTFISSDSGNSKNRNIADQFIGCEVPWSMC